MGILLSQFESYWNLLGKYPAHFVCPAWWKHLLAGYASMASRNWFDQTLAAEQELAWAREKSHRTLQGSLTYRE